MEISLCNRLWANEAPSQQIDGEYAAQTVMLPAISSWRKRGEATLEERDGVAIVSTRSTEDGVIIPITAIGSEVLGVRMEYDSGSSGGPWGLESR